MEIKTTEQMTQEIYNYVENLIINAVKNALPTATNIQITIDSNVYMIESSILLNTVKKIYLNNVSILYQFYYTFSGRYFPDDRTKFYNYRINLYYYATNIEQRNEENRIINQFIDDINSKIKYSKSLFDKIIFLHNYFKLNNYALNSSTASTYSNIANVIKNKNGNLDGYNNLFAYILNLLQILYFSTKSENIVSGFIIYNNNFYYHVNIEDEIKGIFQNLILKSDEYIENYLVNCTSKIIGADFEEEYFCLDNRFDFYID